MDIMSQHDRLIDRLISDKTLREVTRAMVDHGTRGWKDDHVVALVHELAAAPPANQTPQQAGAYIVDFCRNIGVPSYHVDALSGWMYGGSPGWEPPLPPDPHEALISSLWDDESERESARHFARTWDVPGMEGRVEALLRRAAANDGKVAAGEISERQARDDLAQFMQEGAPAEMVDGIGEWFADAETEDRDDYDLTPISPAGVNAMMQAMRSPPPAPPPPTPTGPTRAELQDRIASHERNMRAEPGSAQWKEYWQRGGSADCLDARRALEAADMTQVTAEPAA
jgi:hypothetical protein